MGYTQWTLDKVMAIIKEADVKQMLDLGAQNNYAQPKLPAPYMRETFEAMGLHYMSVDLTGECGALPWDLSLKLMWLYPFDLVVDAGTSEHVGNNGQFSWEAIYNCWFNKHDALNIGGYMYSENPKTGNWPGHGFNYYTEEFYKGLATLSGYEIDDLGEHAACNNTTDGWNVYCTMIKNYDKFPTFEEFQTLALKQS
jgi:hypothetical protein